VSSILATITPIYSDMGYVVEQFSPVVLVLGGLTLFSVIAFWLVGQMFPGRSNVDGSGVGGGSGASSGRGGGSGGSSGRGGRSGGSRNPLRKRVYENHPELGRQKVMHASKFLQNAADVTGADVSRIAQGGIEGGSMPLVNYGTWDEPQVRYSGTTANPSDYEA